MTETNKAVKKILIVDDEVDVLANLSKILDRAGYTVLSTDKGKEAVFIAASQVPDLILLDIVMPDMYGEDVAATLLKNPITSNIPIIFLTALLNKDEESRLKKYCPRYHVMAKPVISDELLKHLDSFLKS